MRQRFDCGDEVIVDNQELMGVEKPLGCNEVMTIINEGFHKIDMNRKLEVIIK